MTNLENKANTTMMQINNKRTYVDRNPNDIESNLDGPYPPDEDCRGNDM